LIRLGQSFGEAGPRRHGFTCFLAVAAALFAAAVTTPAPAHAQPVSPVSLLDVPYLSQSEALCGGAAAAMVMRFWGATGVYAETFASLVGDGAAGIRAEDLIDAFRTRGWEAVSLRGDRAIIAALLGKRQPAIAMIEDRPGRFHYVVIVGWAGGKVIFHDPARAPFRVADEAEFARRWQPTGFWVLMALPPRGNKPRSAGGLAPTRAEPANAPIPGGACGAMVAEGVRLSEVAQPEDARRLLEAATVSCPDDAGPWRELAGLHALKQDWGRASADARRALDRDPRDAHAARILATASFLEGDDLSALDAWNLVDEPAIDRIDIRGLDRLRYDVAASAIGLRTGTMLTRGALERARKRLDAIPGLIAARVDYRPAEDGRTTIAGAVLERSAVPSGPIGLGSLAIGAAVSREIVVDVANLSGGGEVWSASWRWWEHRPRVGVRFASPSPFGGTWSVDFFDERQTYGRPGSETEQRQRAASFTLADWVTPSVRVEGSAGFDRVDGTDSLRLGAAVRHSAASDRLTSHARVAVWRGGLETWAMGAAAGWRSRAPHQGTVWLASAGFDLAATDAPLAVWPGASSGEGRPVLLRAHPLLERGIVRDGVFGPRLLHASAEWRRWSAPKFKVLRFAPAVFVDTARAWSAPAYADGRAHVDAGAGLRVAIPAAGVLRVDVAKGWRDGATAVSVGWSR
jgi:hypothetical protein